MTSRVQLAKNARSAAGVFFGRSGGEERTLKGRSPIS